MRRLFFNVSLLKHAHLVMSTHWHGRTGMVDNKRLTPTKYSKKFIFIINFRQESDY